LILRARHQPRSAEPPVRGGVLFNFVKIEHTTFSLPLVFAGAWVGTQGRWPALSLLIWIVAAAIGARVFGMALNRIFDRRIDAANPRTANRELPLGVIGLKTALATALGGLTLYLIACAALGGWCLMLSPLPLIPLLGYSLLKRFTALCHFGIGLCLALAPMGAFVAVTGTPRFTPAIVWFAVFVWLWLSGADIIYAILDIDSDRANGIHSIPARIGQTGALWTSAICHAASVACLVMVFILTGRGSGSAVALALAALILMIMYWPSVPMVKRFFPISTMAGIAAAMVPIAAPYAGG
jgi:4-hydroxybenzoate polyprenyltransferase